MKPPPPKSHLERDVRTKLTDLYLQLGADPRSYPGLEREIVSLALVAAITRDYVILGVKNSEERIKKEVKDNLQVEFQEQYLQFQHLMHDYMQNTFKDQLGEQTRQLIAQSRKGELEWRISMDTRWESIRKKLPSSEKQTWMEWVCTPRGVTLTIIGLGVMLNLLF